MCAGVHAGACVSSTPVDQLLSCDVQLLTTCPGDLVSSTNYVSRCPSVQSDASTGARLRVDVEGHPPVQGYDA